MTAAERDTAALTKPASPADATATATEVTALGWRSWLPVGATALPFVVLSVVAALHAREIATPFGDTAVISLRTLAASRGHELLGPYSRFGWQHPGPAFFYWAAPFFRASGARPGGLALAAATSNLVWVVVLVTAARRAAGTTAAWVLGTVVVFASWRFGMGWLHNPWNPLLIVLPIAACGVLGAAVAARVRWALPMLALTASYAVQTHVGTAPVVAVMLLVTLTPAVWQQRRRWRDWTRAVVATAVVSVAVWLPAIAEEIAHRPGNLSQLFDFFRDHHGTKHPLGEVLRLTAPQLSLTASDLGGRISGSTTLLRPISSVGLALLALTAVALGAGLSWAVRTKRPFLWALNAAALAGGVTAIYSTRSAFGDLEAYFTSFSTGIGILAWSAILLTLVTVARERLDHRPTDQVLRQRARAGVVLRTVALVAVLGVAGATTRVGDLARIADRPSVSRLVDWAEAGFGDHPHQRVLVRFIGPDPWVDGAGLMAELERRGTRVSVRPELTYLFGPTYRSRDNEQMTLIITHPYGQKPGTPDPAGARYLGTNVDGMALWVAPGRVYGPPDSPDDGTAG